MAGERLWDALASYRRLFRKAPPAERSRLLDEFCQLTDYHREYAITPLNRWDESNSRRRCRGPTYSRKSLEVMEAVWRGAGYPWSVRLEALIPQWLPWARKHIDSLTPEVEKAVISIRPRQSNRRLAFKKRRLEGRRYDRAEEVRAMNGLYRGELRLMMNLLRPSVKLMAKERLRALPCKPSLVYGRIVVLTRTGCPPRKSSLPQNIQNSFLHEDSPLSNPNPHLPPHRPTPASGIYTKYFTRWDEPRRRIGRTGIACGGAPGAHAQWMRRASWGLARSSWRGRTRTTKPWLPASVQGIAPV